MNIPRPRHTIEMSLGGYITMGLALTCIGFSMGMFAMALFNALDDDERRY